MSMEPSEAVFHFLESVAPATEAEFYLNLFRAQARESFAVIVVQRGIAEHALDAVAVDMRCLAALGLTPVVLLGVDSATQVQQRVERLVHMLKDAGVSAAETPPVVSDIQRTAVSATIPVVALPPKQDHLVFLKELLATLHSQKLVFLHRRGGLRRNGRRLGVLNLSAEYAETMDSKDITKEQKSMVELSKELIWHVSPERLLVAITAPWDLLRELFSIKGAGTLLRRGSIIQQHAGLQGVDNARLSVLLQAAFGRKVKPGFFARPISHVYLESTYRGAALIVDTPLGAYLTKFAVTKDAQGEGIGSDLWSALVADQPRVFWRARADNPILSWYIKQCTGMHHQGAWYVFWRGVEASDIPEVARYCAGQPVDLDGAPG